MRLIDADKIDFKKVFGGNSEFARDIIDGAQRLIDSQPAAFDKEKVIEELDKCKQIMLSPASKDCFGEECRENDCMACVFNKAIEIVEKGGIE
jgi:hypothetical protein